MSARDCVHGQLARSCPLCQAAKDIRDAWFEGYQRGWSNGCFRTHETNRTGVIDTKAEEAEIALEWNRSSAKSNSADT